MTSASSNPADDLPAPGATQDLLLPGAAGDIEVTLAAPRVPARGYAVICHPHPLFGGAMSNKVTYTLASIALKAGFYALRFNFRGVGKSAGTHDEGVGETEDTLLMVDWLRQRMPAASPLLLAGFSFGGYVSVRAAERARPNLQISVAPPFGGRFAYAERPQRPDCPWLVIHSRDDDVVAYDDTAAALDAYDPPPELVTVDGAGHFFNGRLGDLQSAAGAFIERHLAWP
ncbi:alpha/beta hydrolase [Hydrocarboniphaga effusa]|uniref:alpha/beta hydrolase n=1 Tax=Hydrocarboniphaga effusa TaxID=243629 RepID=UPI003BA85EB0